MISEYQNTEGKGLRYGYTTGTCATAAAAAAAEMLLKQSAVSSVTVKTPKGISLSLEVLNAFWTAEWASCAVQKDSGDDPDITNGILVCANVEKCPAGVELEGGEGIGRVTKAGLDQPVGAAAINHIPREMIEAAVMEICRRYHFTGGLRIVLSIPGGETLAEKTMNPRLGIVGGLSILGTSGIVEPMSQAAILGTIRAEMRVRYAEGKRNVLLTPGNYGKGFLAQFFPSLREEAILCSNFIGESLDLAAETGFSSVLILGHIGKLVKLGAGIMNTHSAQADGRAEVLVTCGVLAGVPLSVLRSLLDCVTTDAMLEKLEQCGKRRAVLQILMERIQQHLLARARGQFEIGAVLFSERYGMLGKTEQADVLLKKLMEDTK